MRNLYLLIISAFLLLLSSCTSVQKSFEKKDYKTTINTVIDRISKNKKVTDEELQFLELAYERAIENDKSRIALLKQKNTVSSWTEVFNTYTNMMYRQDAVLKVAPIYYSSGKIYTPTQFDYNSVREEARENIAELHYKEAVRLLNTSSRANARLAYNELDCIFYYYKDYKDAVQLLDIARDKGTTHILMSVEKNPQLYLPQDFEYELLNYDYSRSLNNWMALYTNSDERKDFDFAVKLIITQSYVSPGIIKENSYRDEKEIEDGWKYVYDKNGNVTKDSAGNDIKVPKYSTLSAKIIETQMNRSATIRGTVDFYDYKSRRVIKQEVAQGESVFNYQYATYNGNVKALSSESLNKIKNGPAPFPSDADMILLATEQLKSQFGNIFYSNRQMMY
ncbi:MAG TPA: hypothetical protein VLZ75_11510 [Chitinophagales bacterium]|nr:hypothetical protein [Chitinophagales bacterium]